MNPSYKQGDLVYLADPVKLPKGEPLGHPVLIVSSNSANSYEKFYTGLMMSSTIHTDRFSFKCSDLMFENPLRKPNSQIRLYITVSFKESEVVRFSNRMKPIFLKQVLEQFKDLILVVD